MTVIMAVVRVAAAAAAVIALLAAASRPEKGGCSIGVLRKQSGLFLC